MSCARIIIPCERIIISCARIIISCARIIIPCGRIIISFPRIFISCARIILSCARIFIWCARIIIRCERIIISCARTIKSCARIIMSCAQIIISFFKHPTSIKCCFLKSWTEGVLTIVQWDASLTEVLFWTNEPPHDRTNKMTVRPAKTQMPRLIWVFAGRTCVWYWCFYEFNQTFINA